MNDDSAIKMGIRLKAERNAAGLTAVQAAAASGMTKSAWLNYECGIRSPHISKIPALAKAVNSTASYLAMFTDHKGEAADEWPYVVARDESGKIDSSRFLSFEIGELKQRGISERDIVFIPARDNAMAPEINEGDMVLIDKKKNTATDNAIYAVIDPAGNAQLRRIRPDIEGGYTMLANDKTAVDDVKLTQDALSNIRILGRYVGLWHWPTK
ncbi:hypothetical protein A1OW_10375 [Enterovibrio norvegicus]|uniref:LexA family transcriptional regulator n=1 Tax=Enterovibrio norvegicus TaxID=188144 RepID=UPI000308636D|nr:LexA family transcriptional regulator [Enterovibrio norvegicus]OEF50998.1 hypothetical protein A1OW_10375 [Enterovibrio norvegicus]